MPMINRPKQLLKYELDYYTLHWFAVVTRSRHEKKVKELLDEQKVENFLPMTKEYHRWSDRKKVVEVPLIKGYIFVRIAAKNAIYVTRIPGASRFVKFKNELAPIPDFQIQALMLATSSGVKLKKIAYLEAGQDVEVCDGPMKGSKGKLLRIENESRFVITLDFPPSAYEIRVKPEQLKPYRKEDEQKKIRVEIPLGM